MNKVNWRKDQQAGQLVILSLVVIGVILVSTLTLVGGSQLFIQNTAYTNQSAQAVNLAEAGLDKAIASLNATGGSYSGEAETILGNGSYSVAVTTPDSGTKVIESTAYLPSKQNAKVRRTVKATVSKGVGISFNYGVQVGEGGLEMFNDSTINGSLYSNGSVQMGNNARILGDAYVAGGTAPMPDQEHDCTMPNCADFIFGKNVGGQDVLDVAQSFKPGSGNYINKVALKLKKISTPPDILVRIMSDQSGRPNKNNVLASGVLTANLVTSQYGFVEVTLSTTPYLNTDTPYWIMMDTSSNPANYWSWSSDLSQGYTRGQAKWSPNWQAGNPTWNLVSGDLNFKTYMGGLPTSIIGSNGATIGGDAKANTLQNLTISEGAYYQTSQNITAGSYHPNSPDPPPQNMPVSEANIQAWKDGAEQSGIYTGDITSCPGSLGPGKYVGNVNLNNNCTVTITDPVWITEDLSLNNNITFRLDSGYGSASGVVIVDGRIHVSNNIVIRGSGTAGSFLMMLSTYDSRTNGIEAVKISNGGNSGIFYAPFGIAEVENNNHLNELTAWKIELENGVTIDYDTGLASAFFTSGPSGSYSLVKGTYQIK